MPRSIFSHFATVLVCTLLLAVTSSSAGPVESAQPTIDDALIYEIVTHARPVQLFTQLTNNNILVIIGSTKHSGIDFVLTDTHVFEQPLENLGSDIIHLKSSTPFLTRWPTVTGSYRAMFAVPDSTGDNIILDDDNNYNGYALHLSTGTLEALPKLNGNSTISVLEYAWTLSSAEPVHYFWADRKSPSCWVAQHFNSTTLDQATQINYDKSYYICDSGLSSSGQQSINVSPTDCQVPIKWNITTGFINTTSVLLVDKTNSVLIFDRSVLTSGQPTDVIKIPAAKFWVKWVPPLEPSNRTQVPSTEKPTGTEWTEPPTTAKWPVVLVLAIAVPNLLLVLCLITLGIYCFCKPKQSSDKSVLAKPSKAAGGPRNLQDLKSAARATRNDTKEKHGSSATNLKTKVRSSTVAKKATASRSSHLPGKSASTVSKAFKNANASTSKRSLAGQIASSRDTPL